MFKESPIPFGSGGRTESSRKLEKKAADIPDVQEARRKTEEFRRLSLQERTAQIHSALEAENLKRALVLVDFAPEQEQVGLHRSIYGELVRRGEFLNAARLAQMKMSAHPLSTGRHNFTEADVHLSAIQAYHAAKENPQPIEKMEEPPVAFEGYIPNDYETPDHELIKREFGLTDEDVGPSLSNAA